ncbi:MAG: Gfo/Idh/MocA family protein [Tepidanaerobacteraceae bacterium]|jgi:predicted dehydrogenase
MKKKFKISVIGCGQIAQMMHIPYIIDQEDLEIHSLCDISKSVVEFCGEKFNVPPERCFTNYKEMLKDSSIDLVVISTMDHYEPSLAASKAGVNQLIEKPLAFNVEQADDMIREAEKNNVWIAVGYMKCFDPNFEYFKNKVENIRDIRYVKVHDFGGNMAFTTDVYDLCAGKDIPEEARIEGARKQREGMLAAVGDEALLDAYFVMLMTCSHDMAILRRIFGKPLKVDYASAVGNMITAVMDYGTFKCTLEGSWLDSRMTWDEEITVYSNECKASIRFPWPYLKNAPSVVSINENEGTTNVDRQIVSSFDEAYRCEWKYLVNCLKEGSKPEISAEFAREDLQIYQDMITKMKENM